MKITQLLLVALAAIISAACHTSKKTSTMAATEVPAAPVTTSPVSTKPADGIYPPGIDELIAIQVKYKEVTLEKLQKGHKLYTEGACINCHAAANIYMYGEYEWIGIMDNMARKARITDEEKDAVYKYVLAIKAAKPEGSR